MSISATTIALLIDAGVTGDMLKRIAASIENDVTLSRNSVTPDVTQSVTPAAVRMRRMRERKLNQNNVLDAEKAASVAEPERNSVTPESVTSYNNNSTSLEADEEKKERIVRSVTRKRNSYTPLFETFWSQYPTDAGMSKAEAFKVFDKLSPEDQQAAIAAIPAFRQWVAKQGDNYRTVHAVRYLSQRRFEGFAAEQIAKVPGQTRVPVLEGTDAWNVRKARGEKFPSVDIKDDNGRVIGRGWYFPTEYPEQEAA